MEYPNMVEKDHDNKTPEKWLKLMRYLLTFYPQYTISENEAAKMIDAYFELDHKYLDSTAKISARAHQKIFYKTNDGKMGRR